MTLALPIETLFILNTLQNAGYSAYIVGGAVRDLILVHDYKHSTSVTDFDFTTNATPEQIRELFPESYYENDFGTVSITHENLRDQLGLPALETEHDANDDKQNVNVSAASKLHPSLKLKEKVESNQQLHPPYEITTFRTDGEYTDYRRPSTVAWGKTLEEDLDRRDFTINSMAIQVTPEKLSSIFSSDGAKFPEQLELTDTEFSIIDPHNGKNDLSEKLIRTVGDPQQRFKEDALRMLRAIRFSVQLGFAIEANTAKAIFEHAELLQHISGERIRDEFFKMLLSPEPKKAIEMLDEANLLGAFLPELLACKGVQQSGHHITDVWVHSLDALAESPSKDPIVKLATLLHDIAKPITAATTNSGTVTFYNHEVLGSRIGKAVADRLKLSKKDTDRVFVLIRFHMFHYQPENTDASIRRFMRKVGLDNLNDILDLREADRLGSGAKKTSWRLEEMKERMEQQLNQPFDVTDLAISGNDLIKDLQLKPGPIFREILQKLLEEVLEQPELNTREILLKKAKTLYSESQQH